MSNFISTIFFLLCDKPYQPKVICVNHWCLIIKRMAAQNIHIKVNSRTNWFQRQTVFSLILKFSCLSKILFPFCLFLAPIVTSYLRPKSYDRNVRISRDSAPKRSEIKNKLVEKKTGNISFSQFLI